MQLTAKSRSAIAIYHHCCRSAYHPGPAYIVEYFTTADILTVSIVLKSTVEAGPLLLVQISLALTSPVVLPEEVVD